MYVTTTKMQINDLINTKHFEYLQWEINSVSVWQPLDTLKHKWQLTFYTFVIFHSVV